MMKTIQKFAVFCFAALLLGGLVFVSCNKDDDNGGNNGKTDPSTIAATNLIAYFPFQTEGETVQKANGTITFNKKVGNASLVPGRRGNAYSGSATEAYFEYDLAAGNPLLSLDEFTLACWIKTPVITAGAAKIFTVNGGDSFMGTLSILQESQATGDSVDMKAYLFDAASAEWKGQDFRKRVTAFLNDKWFHFAVMYRKSTSTFEFYANGLKVAEQVKYGGPKPTGADQPLLAEIALGSDMTKLHFGTWTQQIAGTPESWMKYYNGLVDEFRIYNKALSDTEIAALYAAEVLNINAE